MSNKPILVLRLEGPLQSWGERARWDYRDTAALPTKSGIIGLIACAMGLPRRSPDIPHFDHCLKMAVRAESPGRIMTDYHTLQGAILNAEGKLRHHKGETGAIVSNRQYLQDASFLVALSGDEEILERCRWALNNPVWPVFLGRKNCPPTRPVLEEITHDYVNLDEVMSRYPDKCQGDRRIQGEIEDDDGLLVRRDRPTGMPGRVYGMRRVRLFRAVPQEEVE